MIDFVGNFRNKYLDIVSMGWIIKEEVKRKFF
jgi:hypothetical protein